MKVVKKKLSVLLKEKKICELCFSLGRVHEQQSNKQQLRWMMFFAHVQHGSCGLFPHIVRRSKKYHLLLVTFYISDEFICKYRQNF